MLVSREVEHHHLFVGACPVLIGSELHKCHFPFRTISYEYVHSRDTGSRKKPAKAPLPPDLHLQAFLPILGRRGQIAAWRIRVALYRGYRLELTVLMLDSACIKMRSNEMQVWTQPVASICWDLHLPAAPFRQQVKVRIDRLRKGCKCAAGRDSAVVPSLMSIYLL